LKLRDLCDLCRMVGLCGLLWTNGNGEACVAFCGVWVMVKLGLWNLWQMWVSVWKIGLVEPFVEYREW
jgi:hypothetical protein